MGCEKQTGASCKVYMSWVSTATALTAAPPANEGIWTLGRKIVAGHHLKVLCGGRLALVFYEGSLAVHRGIGLLTWPNVRCSGCLGCSEPKEPREQMRGKWPKLQSNYLETWQLLFFFEKKWD